MHAVIAKVYDLGQMGYSSYERRGTYEMLEELPYQGDWTERQYLELESTSDYSRTRRALSPLSYRGRWGDQAGLNRRQQDHNLSCCRLHHDHHVFGVRDRSRTDEFNALQA